MACVTVSFTADTEDDADLLAAINKQDKRKKSHFIRAMIRKGMAADAVTLSDIDESLGEIKRMLRGGVVAVQGLEAEAEDPESAAVMSKLRDLGV